jgi:hypothetical protein
MPLSKARGGLECLLNLQLKRRLKVLGERSNERLREDIVTISMATRNCDE